MTELMSRDEKEFYQIQVDTPVLDKHEKEVQDFLDNYDVMKVQSAMATQKSNIIQELITQVHNKDQTVLLITNRITLADDAYGKYNDLKHYRHKDYVQGDSLVVQFDSLFWYNLDYFDVVILDEITSLLLYVSDTYSGKEGRYRKNIEMLMKVGQKKLFVSDAFIIDLPFIETENILGIYNNFRESLHVIEYKSKFPFFSKIIREAGKGIISVSGNEKRVLHKLEKQFQKRGLKVLKLTADLSLREKENVFKLLNDTENFKYDVFLFSPTLTVGVSILLDIKHHFHFDNSSSMDVISSIQMTRRSRNAKNIHFYISAISSFKTTNISGIEKRLDLFQMVNKYGVSFGLTEAGKKLAKIKQMRNIFDNTHKYAFRELLTYQFNNVEYDSRIGEAFIL